MNALSYSHNSLQDKFIASIFKQGRKNRFFNLREDQAHYIIGSLHCFRILVIVLNSSLVPSRPPTLVKAWNTSSTSIQVSWQPLNDSYYEHGVLLGYLLSYRRADGRGGEDSTIICPGALNGNITELDEYVEYTITVQAINIKGIGPASQPVSCTTDEDGICFNLSNHRSCEVFCTSFALYGVVCSEA